LNFIEEFYRNWIFYCFLISYFSFINRLFQVNYSKILYKLFTSNIASKKTYSVKIETHAKHGNHHHKEKWSFHAVYKKFRKASTEWILLFSTMLLKLIFKLNFNRAFAHFYLTLCLLRNLLYRRELGKRFESLLFLYLFILYRYYYR